jgi:hypothetical protein
MRHPLARPLAIVVIFTLLVNLWPSILLPTPRGYLAASAAPGAPLPTTPQASPTASPSATATPGESATATPPPPLWGPPPPV